MPALLRSAITVSLSSSNTSVPVGTFRMSALAVGAVAVLTHAVAAGRAFEVLLVAIVDQRVEAVGASIQTSPPRPPSPPSGPPKG
jgi:hypothetical protein